MKKLTFLMTMLAISMIAGAQGRTINFTPHEGLKAGIWQGKIYSQWDYNQNKDGIKQAMSLGEWRNLPKSAKLGKQLLPTQTIHFTEVNIVDVATGNFPGLNYIFSKSWNSQLSNLFKAYQMVFIKEDANAIAEQIKAWYRGDTTETVILTTKEKKQWNVGDLVPVHVWANNSFKITIPPWLEFVSIDLSNDMQYKGNTWCKIFGWNHQLIGNVLHVTVVPSSLFHTNPKAEPLDPGLIDNPEFGYENPVYNYRNNPWGTSNYHKGKRTLGSMVFKVIAPVDGYIPDCQEGYIYAK
ncbi:MAG: hypothetical protein IH597_01695 [Bacteroidales bacterium]|nr:hypothetical protein [Bacteroidales bacterium]